MASVLWDPNQYLHYDGERIRPFLELLARIDCDDPHDVFDLGCGPGNATRLLAERWQHARVVGVDNSSEMLDQAAALIKPGHLEFERADISSWNPDRLCDVIFSNAAFQWVPRHVERFASFIESLRPGGWFAFQVPNMSDAPSHKTMNDLAKSPEWKDKIAHLVDSLIVEDVHDYVAALHRLGCAVDAWETTYMQVLSGDDPIVEWVRGSSMRPFLTALSPEDSERFVSSYRAKMQIYYPRGQTGTIFPFRRTFVVAHKPD